MEQLDPEQAARELRNELRNPSSQSPLRQQEQRPAWMRRSHKREEVPPTESQRGMGIASLVVGIIIAVVIVPGFYFLSPLCLLLLIPGAIFGLIFGWAGSRTASGVAGIALSSIAILEGLTVFGVYEFKAYEEEQSRLRAEKEARARESTENMRINDERAKAEALARKAVAEADAEHTRMAMRREDQAQAALEERQRIAKEQAPALEAAKHQDEVDRASREQVLLQQQAREKQALADNPIKNDRAIETPPAETANDLQRADTAKKLAAAQALYRQKAANLDTAKSDSVRAKTALRVAEADVQQAINNLNELNNMRPSPDNINQLRETYFQRRNKGEADAAKARRSIEETDRAFNRATDEEKSAREALAVYGAAVKALEPEAKKSVTIYVLKDGRSIAAIGIAATEDEYVLKTETGMQTVKKDEVAEIKKDAPATAQTASAKPASGTQFELVLKEGETVSLPHETSALIFGSFLETGFKLEKTTYEDDALVKYGFVDEPSGLPVITLEYSPPTRVFSVKSIPQPKRANDVMTLLAEKPIVLRNSNNVQIGQLTLGSARFELAVNSTAKSRSLLNLAQQYMNNGNAEQAVAVAKQLINDFSDSPEAKEAKVILKVFDPDALTQLPFSKPKVASDPASDRSTGAFGQRDSDGRKLMIGRYGGSKATEDSVELALKWLALHQEADGHWDSAKYGAANKVDTAMTSLALLALLSAGNTEKVGSLKSNVARGVAWLKSKQQANGMIFDETDSGGHRGIGYPTAIATLAITEAAGMGREPTTISSAQRAINYCTQEHQQGEGANKLGWRYSAKSAGDISVSGWFIMALKSAKVAGLTVDRASFDGATKFLDSVEIKDGVSKYTYQPGKDPNKRRCAIGNLARQFLGSPRDQLQASVESFVNDGGVPKWGVNGDSVDLYYWYYGSLCTFQQGGELWNRWNGGMKEALTENQCKLGDDAGSWPIAGDFCGEWGRVGQTALACLCLEVYYRYRQLGDKN